MVTNWLATLFDIELLQLKQSDDLTQQNNAQLQIDLNLMLESAGFKLVFTDLNMPFEISAGLVKVSNLGLTGEQKKALWHTLWQQI
ncbi:hypothetical protein [Pseudoalteromonas spongiae]|uniref:hypothetical protein n=1 Tax=Pseudoalteromonas spongiae TaxID=298657 RepID=UPI0037367827